MTVYYFRYKIRDIYDQYSENWSPTAYTEPGVGGGSAAGAKNFSWPSNLTLNVGDLSQRWYPKDNLTAKGISISLETAGSTTTTAEVYKNTSLIGTISLTSGQHYLSSSITPATITGRADYVQVKLTAVGTSAAGIDVQVEV